MSNKKTQKFHRLDCLSLVKNKSPHFDAVSYLKAKELQKDAKRVREIDKENMKLLKKINLIHRFGGYVDCWASHIKYKSNLIDNQNRRNNKIMQENKTLLQKICQAESQYPVRKILKAWQSHQETVGHRSKYVSVIQRMSIASNIRKQLADKNQTKCFFDIGVEEENRKLGRIVFQLYDNVVPLTCKNFAAFCRGINGLSYKNTPFHRIVYGYWCQGGDVIKFNGTGGTSIYGDSFDKENFNLHHIGPGILSTCDDNGKNDSKFNLTFKCLQSVDGDKVVFGQVIDGMANIYKIEAFGTKTGNPIKSVIVLNCGVLSGKRALSELQI